MARSAIACTRPACSLSAQGSDRRGARVARRGARRVGGRRAGLHAALIAAAIVPGAAPGAALGAESRAATLLCTLPLACIAAGGVEPPCRQGPEVAATLHVRRPAAHGESGALRIERPQAPPLSLSPRLIDEAGALALAGEARTPEGRRVSILLAFHPDRSVRLSLMGGAGPDFYAGSCRPAGEQNR